MSFKINHHSLSIGSHLPLMHFRLHYWNAGFSKMPRPEASLHCKASGEQEKNQSEARKSCSSLQPILQMFGIHLISTLS